jgi:protein-S-isoprenylcysteine O-methyltransferase Ste14
MKEKPQKEKDVRKIRRILALILSGFVVIILLPLISVLGSQFLNFYLHLPEITPYPLNVIIASVILLIGFFWAGWSNIELFNTGKGSPIPLKDTQTTVLVIKGPYKYTRNPMVFGYILIWVGLGFLFNSYIILIGFTCLIFLFLIIFIKFWEERNLEQRFGQSYADYKKKVSMIIPLPMKKH